MKFTPAPKFGEFVSSESPIDAGESAEKTVLRHKKPSGILLHLQQRFDVVDSAGPSNFRERVSLGERLHDMMARIRKRSGRIRRDADGDEIPSEGVVIMYRSTILGPV